MSTEVLHIGLRDAGDTRVVRLSGELDAYSSDRLRNISETWVNDAKRVVVDLDDLLYIDSAGLSVLVWMWVEARDRGAELVLTCNNPRIHRVLEITGLLKIFSLETELEPAKGTTFVSAQPAAPIGVTGLVSSPVSSVGMRGTST